MLTRDARYPHLLEIDGLIWHEHRLAHQADYTKLEYDVFVGEGRDPGESYPASIRSMALALSRRRVDVVAHTPAGLDIIEVTHSAGFTAVGQLICYPVLYQLTYSPGVPIRPVLVAGEVQTDIMPVLERLHIEVYEYGLP